MEDSVRRKKLADFQNSSFPVLKKNSMRSITRPYSHTHDTLDRQCHSIPFYIQLRRKDKWQFNSNHAVTITWARPDKNQHLFILSWFNDGPTSPALVRHLNMAGRLKTRMMGQRPVRHLGQRRKTADPGLRLLTTLARMAIFVSAGLTQQARKAEQMSV